MIQQFTSALKLSYKKISAQKKPSWHLLLLISLFILFLAFSYLVFRYAPDFFIGLGKSRKYDFEKTGTTGDTFGGILGPLIAWLAAILTFAAFWVQYKSNLQQKSDLQKERLENRFFEMIKLHKDNVNEMVIEGYDIIDTYETEHSGIPTDHSKRRRKTSQEIIKETTGRKIFVTTYTELKACHEICKRTLSFESTIPNKERYLIKMAYHFFYNGAGSDIVKEIDSTIPNDKEYIEKCRVNLKAASSQHVNSSSQKNKFEIPESNYVVNLFIKYKPFSGHASRFGHYYRHLFQMVKYVVIQKNTLLNYSEKREYLRILRAQLSDQEQAMLYFNYLSGFGGNWESSQNKFFSDYRMIHNMPLYMADFTIAPEVEFEKQILRIKNTGEEMFEEFEKNA